MEKVCAHMLVCVSASNKQVISSVFVTSYVYCGVLQASENGSPVCSNNFVVDL